MSFARRLAQRVTLIEDRALDALRSRAAHGVSSDAATGDLASFRGRRYCVLVTYRRDGTAVPSPLWFAEVDGRLYVHTGGWKLKRVVANPRVRVAPSRFRGQPLAPPVDATARVVPPEGRDRAESALAAKYGLVRRLYYATLGRGQHDLGQYVEITPGQDGEDGEDGRSAR